MPDLPAINAVLAELARETGVRARARAGAVDCKTEFVVGRYPQQTWRSVLRQARFDDPRQVQQLVESFRPPARTPTPSIDPASAGDLACPRTPAANDEWPAACERSVGKPAPTQRAIYLRGLGRVSAALRRLGDLPAGQTIGVRRSSDRLHHSRHRRRRRRPSPPSPAAC
jgi:hypothetical protein